MRGVFTGAANMNPIDWREDLIHYLVTAGTVGRTQMALTTRMRKHVTAEQIIAEMESLHEEGKVQKFSVPTPSGKGPSATVWRATTKILEA